jgi:hypothetical protein
MGKCPITDDSRSTLLPAKCRRRMERQRDSGRADSEHTQSELTIEKACSPKDRIAAPLVLAALKATKSRTLTTLPERKETRWKTFRELVCHARP